MRWVLAYVFGEQSDNVRTDDAGKPAHAVGQCHDHARIIWCQIDGIRFDSRVKGAHEGHAKCEHGNDSHSIASSVRCEYDEYGRSDGSDRCEQFSRKCDAQVFAFDQIVAQETRWNANDPQAQIR